MDVRRYRSTRLTAPLVPPDDALVARATPRTAGVVVLLFAPLMMACGDIHGWSDPEILVHDDGSIGVIANRWISVFHGGSGNEVDSRCVRAPDGAWSCGRLDSLGPSRWITPTRGRRWFRTRAGREYVVFDSLRLFTSVDGERWTPVSTDAIEVSGEEALDLAFTDSVGVAVAVAPQESGEEHVLVVTVDRDRGWLFEVSPDLEIVRSEEVPLPQ